MPKFVFDDVPLFKGLIADLFPGLDLPRVAYPALKAAAETELEKMDMRHDDEPTFQLQVDKVIQLFEIILTRHTTMVVGPTGGEWRRCAAAPCSCRFGDRQRATCCCCASTWICRRQDGRHQHAPEGFPAGIRPHHQDVHPQPKGADRQRVVRCVLKLSLAHPRATAGHSTVLYRCIARFPPAGVMDPTTRDWTDGMLSRLFRSCNEPLPPGRDNEVRWIIFDGDVDAEWCVQQLGRCARAGRSLPAGRVRLLLDCCRHVITMLLIMMVLQG